MPKIRERIQFIKTFKSDKNVAAIVPSSKFVVRDVIKRFPKNVNSVIECGPGEGVMTKAVLKRLDPAGRMLVIESNLQFTDILREIHDSRLLITEGRAQDMAGYAKDYDMNQTDLILASIPFSFLKPIERRQFVRDAYELLASEGILIIFHQYSPLMYRSVKKVFGNTKLTLETRNLPPCFIMIARKGIKSRKERRSAKK
ncbi:MAG: methyltransferase [bacterium]|nr:methyltransferase [bacterium]